MSGVRARIAVASALALSLASALPASAAHTDRIAIQARAGETPVDTALAYQDACLRAGVTPQTVWPVESFRLGEMPFVRISVEGEPRALRCFNALTDRQIIDGTIRWLDGPSRGLLLHSPPGATSDTVPDALWYSAPGDPIPSPTSDGDFVDDLIHGSPEAREKLKTLPLDQALPNAAALAARSSAASQAVLEKVAVDDSRWSMRRIAILALDPTVSPAVILDRAAHDPAWEVRLAAAPGVARLAVFPGPHQDDGADALHHLAFKDADWTVRRESIWAMPTKLALESANELFDTFRDPKNDPQLRAIALETLAAMQKTTDAEVQAAFVDSAPEVRAIAAEILVSQLSQQTAPQLWKALHDPNRLVRLAAAPFLDHVDDDSISFALMPLYKEEADRLDADPGFERSALDAIVRHPFPALAKSIVGRLGEKATPPFERRLLSRALATVAPQTAQATLLPDLKSTDSIARSIAADALPYSPSVHALRKTMLDDPDSDVRAGALIGLCRAGDAEIGDLVRKTELDPSPLKQEAQAMLGHCGSSEPAEPRLHTSLANASAPPVVAHSGPLWPALAGMLLILVSVIAVKLTSRKAS